jgi:YegS/Rv2252/BmrU family lipid kinase
MTATLHYTLQEWAGLARVPAAAKELRAAIIYNPTAGGGKRAWADALRQVERVLRDAGVAAEMLATSAPGDATRLARQAARERCDLVIVAGGDGTINEAVKGLAGSQVALAVLPAGTANVVARELQLPLDLPSAMKKILRGTRRRIALGLAVSPLGKFPPRHFLSIGGAGTDAALMAAVDKKTKLRLGVAAYWLKGIEVLARYGFPKFRVHSDGREEIATLIVAGRTKHYGGAYQVTTRADLLENAFEMLTIGAASPWDYLRGLPTLFTGGVRGLACAHTWMTTAARCEALDGARVLAQVDGEILGELPVEFRIVPDALTLVFPA